MTLEELKVAAWDTVTAIEILNRKLIEIRTEILRHEQAAALDGGDKGKK